MSLYVQSEDDGKLQTGHEQNILFFVFFFVQVVSQAFGLKQPYWQKRLVMLVKRLLKHFQKLPEVTEFSNWSDGG